MLHGVMVKMVVALVGFFPFPICGVSGFPTPLFLAPPTSHFISTRYHEVQHHLGNLLQCRIYPTW